MQNSEDKLVSIKSADLNSLKLRNSILSNKVKQIDEFIDTLFDRDDPPHSTVLERRPSQKDALD